MIYYEEHIVIIPGKKNVSYEEDRLDFVYILDFRTEISFGRPEWKNLYRLSDRLNEYPI